MPDDFLIAIPAPTHLETTPAEVNHVAAPLAHSPEQIAATDRVFTHETREAHTVAGLLGLQSSALLLHAVAVETFSPDEEEEDEPIPETS
jgi:hypothetical protein